MSYYPQFRRSISDQKKRLQKMVGKVSDDLYTDLRDTYLPQLVQDVYDAVPIGDTGRLAEGIEFDLRKTKKGLVSMSITAKAYNRNYNYAYIQHERVDYSHDHGTHHFISGPFERMLQDIADVEGLPYLGPLNIENIFGNAGDYDAWAANLEEGVEDI